LDVSFLWLVLFYITVILISSSDIADKPRCNVGSLWQK